MAVTRSHTPKKTKFSDEGELENRTAETAVEVKSVSPEIEENDGSEDSDSDAPEEESTSRTKSSIVAQQKEALRLQKEEKLRQREKRKEQALQNRAQQDKKRQRIQEHELPEFLPEDLFEDEAKEEEDEPVLVPPRTHLRLEELDSAARREAKMEKLRALRNAKNTVVKRGPVHVQVGSFGGRKSVPVAEDKIVGMRDQWLNREALNKK